MKKLTKQQKEEIIKKIQEDKPISDEYRFLIPFETEREYELTYAGKERKRRYFGRYLERAVSAD